MKNLDFSERPSPSVADLKTDIGSKLFEDAHSPGDTTIVKNEINVTVNAAGDHSKGSSSPGRHASDHHSSSHGHAQTENTSPKHRTAPSSAVAASAQCAESDFGSRQTTATGDKTASLDNFKPYKSDDRMVFNPVRPPGLAQFSPGEATTDGARRGLDFRVSQSKTGADCSHQYKVSGELNDGGLMQLKFDTPFTADEKISKSGRLVESNISYGQPINIDFLSVRGERIVERNVTMIQTHESTKNSYVSKVVHANGTETLYEVSPKGEVLNRRLKD